MIVLSNKSKVNHVIDRRLIPKKSHWAIVTFEKIEVRDPTDNAWKFSSVSFYHVFDDEETWRFVTEDLIKQNLASDHVIHHFVAIDVDSVLLPQISFEEIRK